MSDATNAAAAATAATKRKSVNRQFGWIFYQLTLKAGSSTWPFVFLWYIEITSLRWNKNELLIFFLSQFESRVYWPWKTRCTLHPHIKIYYSFFDTIAFDVEIFHLCCRSTHTVKMIRFVFSARCWRVIFPKMRDAEAKKYSIFMKIYHKLCN